MHCTGAELIAREVADTVGRLASAQQARGYPGTPDQEFAWRAQVAALREALRGIGEAWTVALEYDLLRLEKRIDAVVLTDRAIIVLEFKTGEADRAGLAEAEDYALDLRDFHAGSRRHPILPILVAGGSDFVPPAQPPLIWDGVQPPLVAGHESLGAALRWVQDRAPTLALDGAAWLDAAYRPVPTIIEAATMLYARNGVAEIASARADTTNLTRTTDAILRAVTDAQETGGKRLVVVTGIPGAGKTLCGLNAVFGVPESAFLTGNLPLVAVLRAALANDAFDRRECSRKEAARRAKAKLQSIHKVLADKANEKVPSPPPERLIVFDEAQRAWDEDKARKGPRRFGASVTTLSDETPHGLTMSEPAHTLEIMGRHDGWAVVVALIGNGQEINTGEAGLAEWGRVVAADPRWRAVAAPRALNADDPVQRLAERPADWLSIDPDLDLTVPVRSVRESAGAAWVDAVLHGAVAEARDIAAGCALPFLLTRDLDAMRAALRRLARGKRRAGLVASAGAKRLRAEGLGVQVEDVADWFLRRWPDVRASDALETFATEYDCQGLELDVVGLGWGGDLLWQGHGWVPRQFSGHRWQAVHKPADRRHILNTYRVLLTRARYETIIWVPRGSDRGDPFHDPTRDAVELDAIAEFLVACGANALPGATQTSPAPPPMLL